MDHTAAVAEVPADLAGQVRAMIAGAATPGTTPSTLSRHGQGPTFGKLSRSRPAVTPVHTALRENHKHERISAAGSPR